MGGMGWTLLHGMCGGSCADTLKPIFDMQHSEIGSWQGCQLADNACKVAQLNAQWLVLSPRCLKVNIASP